MRGLAVLLALLAFGGCKRADMYTQDRKSSWDRSEFFRNGQSMRAPVAGTVTGEPGDDAPPPAVIDAALVDRGHERYDIFCAPCHGRAGDGEGMIVKRGFPHPPDLDDADLRAAPASRFYDAILKGHGVMYSYADRVPPPDRWAIIAYIRALQTARGPAPGRAP